MAAIKKTAGFTLVELLVSVTVFSLVMAGASTFYVVQSSVRLSEQLGLTMDANLRLAVDTITFSLRNTGYGAPTGSFVSLRIRMSELQRYIERQTMGLHV